METCANNAVRGSTFRQQRSICLKVTPFCVQDIYKLFITFGFTSLEMRHLGYIILYI